MLPNATAGGENKQRLIISILIVLIFLVVIATLIVSFISFRAGNGFNLKNGIDQIKKGSSEAPYQSFPTEVPFQKIPVVLPTGLQTYRFSHGKDVVGPKPGVLTIDPFTPEPGQTQNLSLKATHDSDISKISVEVITDNKKAMHDLSFVSGSATNGTWEGSWIIDDTYSNIYSMRLILVSASETYDEVVNFR